MLVMVYGLVKKVDVFGEFVIGAKEGLITGVKIIPALVALMTCVGMFKESGGIDILVFAVSPITNLLKIPAEVVPLALLRPISGSGALAYFSEILSNSDPNGEVARTASVIMGSTETTFYTIAVYFGAYKIVKTRHTAFCALMADLCGFILSAMIIRLL